MDKIYCDDTVFGNFWARYIWLQGLCIFLAVTLIVLNVVHIADTLESLNRLVERFKSDKQKVRLPYRSQLKMLNQRQSLRPSKKYVQKQTKQKTFDKYEPIINFDDVEFESMRDPSLPVSHSKTVLKLGSRDIQDLITSGDRLNLINKWSFVIIAACLFLIMGSMFLIVNTKSVSLTGEYFIGFGVFLTWISLIKYYEHVKGYNIILDTIANCTEIVIKGVIGIFPVFIGYGIIGTCLFYRSQRFSSIGSTMFTLWAIMFGDILFDVWHDIDQINSFFAQIYVYTFMGFTITAVLKIFIVIIQDGYKMQKYFSRADWVKGVNQRTALHLIQNSEPNNQQQPGFKQENELNKPGMRSLSEQNKLSSSTQIPRLYGVPLPSKGDPFVRLLKKSSRDVKSRIALIKLLRHEKYGAPNTERSVRATASEEENIELAAYFGSKSNEPSHQTINENMINDSTPEGIANYIIHLLNELNEARQAEIDKVAPGVEKEAEQEDVILRYKHNMKRIMNTLNKYKQIE